MTRQVGDVVAERVRRYRTEMGWSVRQLAEECQRLGAPRLTGASIGNIERTTHSQRKRREVTVDEVFVLAYALGMPPLLLMIPLGENEPLQLTTTATVHPHLAWDGATGEGVLTVTGNYATRITENYKGRVVVAAFHALRRAQNAYSGAETNLRIAQDNGSPEQVTRAKEGVADTVPAFAEAVENIMRHGQEVPPYRPETIEVLRRSGILTDPDRLEVSKWTDPGGDDDGQR